MENVSLWKSDQVSLVVGDKIRKRLDLPLFIYFKYLLYLLICAHTRLV